VEGLGCGVDDVMKSLKKILFIIGTAVLIAALFLLYYLAREASKFGSAVGNRKAILQCADYLADAGKMKTNGAVFQSSKISEQELNRIINFAGNLDLLVKTNFVWGTISNREIVVVCPKEFDNVPRPQLLNLYHKNPAHVVGYSDGMVGLISPSEFTNLNLNGFVSEASLVTNSAINIFK
jgi:hypothetical protein